MEKCVTDFRQMAEYNLPSTREEARATGSKFFFTGLLCKNGHMDKSYTSTNRCVTCNFALTAKWQRDNRQRSSQHSLNRYHNNREHCIAVHNEWKKRNKQTIAEYDRKKRARLRNADGTHDANDIRRIRKLQKDRCACCSIRLRGQGQIDHIIALARGGSDWPNNLQILCMPCNRSKHAKDPIDFMQSRGKLL